MKEIYHVEDDPDIAQLVAAYLGRKGFSVSTFPTIAEATAALAVQKPDLCLIDWSMPDGGGDRLCGWIRRKWRELPVIFLTVRGDAADIVACLGCGADDHVGKPFDLEVLHARICALLRRSADGKEDRLLTCGQIVLDQSRMTVSCGTEEIGLSRSEYQLLLLLLQEKGRTVTRERLLDRIWDSNGSYVYDNTLTVTMKRLRKKLHHPSCLKTIRSFGYRMEEEG